jgi:hypothetical protein
MDFAIKCPHLVAGCHRNLVTLQECKILSCHLYKATKGWIGWLASVLSKPMVALNYGT